MSSERKQTYFGYFVPLFRLGSMGNTGFVCQFCGLHKQKDIRVCLCWNYQLCYLWEEGRWVPLNAQTIWRNLIPTKMPGVMFAFIRRRLSFIQWDSVYFLSSEPALIVSSYASYQICISQWLVMDVQLKDSFKLQSKYGLAVAFAFSDPSKQPYRSHLKPFTSFPLRWSGILSSLVWPLLYDFYPELSELTQIKLHS